MREVKVLIVFQSVKLVNFEFKYWMLLLNSWKLQLAASVNKGELHLTKEIIIRYVKLTS